MYQILAVFVTLVLVVACSTQRAVRGGGSAASLAPTTELEATVREAERAFGLQQAGNLDAAAGAYRDAIASPGFAGLAPDEQFALLTVAGHLATDMQRNRDALDLFARASAIEGMGSEIWHLRLSAAYSLHETEDSALCITTVARRWPQTLDHIRAEAIHRVAYDIRDEPQLARQRFELLEALFEANWTDEVMRPDDLWMQLAALWLERDDVAAARRVAARITSTSTLLQMRIDKRFDRVARGDGRTIEAAAAIELDAARLAVEAKPGRLARIMRYQILLQETLKLEEALAVADRVIDRVRDVDGSSVYEDYDEYYRWVLDERANTLELLGRWDEAVAQRRAAARFPENGGLNVSQALNLGKLCAELGRSTEALDAIAYLREMSPYGQMQRESIRLLVALDRGDAAGAASHFAYLRKHRDDALGTYHAALLHTNRIDEAAALLIERLEDPRRRGSMLEGIQKFVDVPRTPLDQENEVRLRAILQRPEVRAVIDRVGRIEEFRITTPRI